MGKEHVRAKLKQIAATAMRECEREPANIPLARALDKIIGDSPSLLRDPDLWDFVTELREEEVGVIKQTEPLELTPEEEKEIRRVAGGMNDKTKKWVINWLQE